MAKSVHQSPAKKIGQGIGHGIKTNNESDNTYPCPQGGGIKRHDRNQEVGIQKTDKGNKEVELWNTLRLSVVSIRWQFRMIPLNRPYCPKDAR